MDPSLIQYRKGPAACLPGSTTTEAKTERKSPCSHNLLVQPHFENPNGPAVSLPGSAIPSSSATGQVDLSFNSSMVLPCVPLVRPPQRRKRKGSVDTVATCWFDRVLKTQMVLLRFCQVLLSPKRKLDGIHCKVLPRTSQPTEPDRSLINSFEPRQEPAASVSGW
jgi:hypothetical protein